MPSRPTITALRDILHHIELAVSFSAGFNRDSFKHDIKTVYAVTRCLEIISEASRRLPDDLKSRHPTIGWKQMAGAGNVYRHDYEDVAAELYGKPWRGHCRRYGRRLRPNSDAMSESWFDRTGAIVGVNERITGPCSREGDLVDV
jgi:uncharacterized protein with HEPN domain